MAAICYEAVPASGEYGSPYLAEALDEAAGASVAMAALAALVAALSGAMPMAAHAAD